MSRALCLGAGITVTLAMASIMLPERRVVIWNVTESVPTGPYWLSASKSIQTGQCVAIKPAATIRRWMAQRGYLPDGSPLIKRVGAIEGQQVCRFRHGITIDGKLAALALARDSLGRPLPIWSGCRKLGADEFFALNSHRPDSLDGRYFGPMPRSLIIGKVVPLGSWIRLNSPSDRSSSCAPPIPKES